MIPVLVVVVVTSWYYIPNESPATKGHPMTTQTTTAQTVRELVAKRISPNLCDYSYEEAEAIREYAKSVNRTAADVVWSAYNGYI